MLRLKCEAVVHGLCAFFQVMQPKNVGFVMFKHAIIWSKMNSSLHMRGSDYFGCNHKSTWILYDDGENFYNYVYLQEKKNCVKNFLTILVFVWQINLSNWH